MPARRLAFAALAALVAAGLLFLAWHTLAPGGWSGWEVAILAATALNLPGFAIAGATGLLGLAALTLPRDPARLLVPGVDAGNTEEPPTLLAVCVRDEDLSRVLPNLAALLRGLGEGSPHAIAILSDTTDPARGAAEDAALARFAAGLPPGQVIHRRRADNAGFKAGNVMEFLDNHAAGFELALLLDADSKMSPALVRRMIRAMAANPRLALLQATIGTEAPRPTPFAELFAIGHGPLARCWAAGQAWWQGGQGAYWGHNALLRVAPFRAHCRLDPLPDGSHILSHDFVEAARLHAAGWEVRVLPAEREADSTERHPPDLAAYLDRDRRWAAGNLQWRHLLRDRRLSRLGRFQMAQAMAHYLLGPAFFALLPLAALNAASGGAEGTPRPALLAWVAASYLAMHACRLCGHLVARTPPGAVLRESLFLWLFDALLAFDTSLTVVSQALGRQRPGWPAQRREGTGVAWGEAARRLWPHTLAGLACLAVVLLSGSLFAALLALPVLAGLVLAIPFCVLTAAPNLSPAPALRRMESGGGGRA
jgi:membrane glycosyltransferase